MTDLISVKCSRIKYLDETPGRKYRRSVSVKISRDYLAACAGEDLAAPDLDSDPDFADAVKDAVEEITGESVNSLEYNFKF